MSFLTLRNRWAGLGILTWAISFAFSAALAVDPLDSAGDEILSIDADSYDLMGSAFRDFKRKRTKWRCFSIALEKSNDVFLIVFHSKDNYTETMDSITINTSKCGTGITYVVSKKGNILKRFYSR